MSSEIRHRGHFDFRVDGTARVILSAAARGRITVTTAAVPPAPWISGEDVAIEARLRSDTRAVTEWAQASRAQYAATLRTGVGGELPLAYDANGACFRTVFTVPPGSEVAGNVSISIDGAAWSSRVTGTVLPSPITLPLDASGRLALKAWSPGGSVSVPLRSRLAGRRFAVTVDLKGPIGYGAQKLNFNAGALEHDIELAVPSDAAGHDNWMGVAQRWFRSAPPAVGSMVLTVTTERGQIIAAAQETPVVIEFRPLWLRIVLCVVLLGPLGYLLLSALRGRRLPAWHLVRYDENGRRVALEDPIPLAKQRRSVNLSRYGVPGARISRSWGGQTKVVLSGTAKLRLVGGTEIAGGTTYPIGVGDTLICTIPAFHAYRIEKF
jgi:hypothetical protein